MNMLGSSNQYLRPEYLSPLPTTLDAKKSPLALLAQTCSNIGADNPNNKPIIPGLEKAKDHQDKKDKSSSSSSSSTSSMSSMGSDDKSSFKPYDKKEESVLVGGGGGSSNSSTAENSCNIGGKKTPRSKSGSPATGTHSPSVVSPGGGSCGGKVSPSGSESGGHHHHHHHHSKSENMNNLMVGGGVSSSSSSSNNNHLNSNNINGNSDSMTTSSSSNNNNSGGSTTSSQNTLTGLGYGSSLGLDLGRLDQASLAAKESLGAMSSHLSSLGAYKHGLNALANCAGCSPVPGHIPVDAASTPHSYQSQNGGPLKPGFSVGSALSPYVGYARVKTATGGTTLVPVCRDPYCTNCQFSMHTAQLSGCPSGCTQCSHDRLPPQLSAAGLHGLGASLIPGLGGGGGSPGGGGGVLNSQLYPHSMLPRPNVCSWMVGDTYCGKRFTTSEELLQHLRTHTNLSAGDNPSTLSLMSPNMSVPSTSVAAWNAACHLHYTTAASLTSQAGLRRAYPTSLSPVSSLSAASRYHPYKPQLPTYPGGPLPPLPHPGLGLYYSPYGLYGQRLGPPVHP